MLPEDAVDVESTEAGAEMHARNVNVFDYGNLDNALSVGGKPRGLATVSFRVRWAGANNGEPVRVVNTADGHAGEYIRSIAKNAAQMEWSATVGDYDFVSADIGTSSSDFAEFGKERNGTFFDSND
ncbi:MAG: hypothetical protein NVS4B3_26810 [Gemmatimonadaceae bacterium]